MKKAKFIAYQTIINTESGEEKTLPEYKIEQPELIKIGTRFLKVCDRAVDSLKKGDLARLNALHDNLEWQTNRLVNKYAGRDPKPLRQKDMAEILGVSERTISSFYRRLYEAKGIFKFDTAYYLNPSFASRSRFIYTEIILRMIDEDPKLESYIAENDLKSLKLIRRTKNMNW